MLICSGVGRGIWFDFGKWSRQNAGVFNWGGRRWLSSPPGEEGKEEVEEKVVSDVRACLQGRRRGKEEIGRVLARVSIGELRLTSVVKLLQMLVDSRELTAAKRVFRDGVDVIARREEWRKADKVLNVFKVFMKWHAKHGKVRVADNILLMVRKCGLDPDEDLYCYYLKACHISGQHGGVKNLEASIPQEKVTVQLYNALLSNYVYRGMEREAKACFGRLEAAGLKLDPKVQAIVVRYYWKIGGYKAAEGYCRELGSLKPVEIWALLMRLCLEDRQYDKAVDLFEELYKQGLVLGRSHYEYAWRALVEMEKIDEAHEMVSRALQANVKCKGARDLLDKMTMATLNDEREERITGLFKNMYELFIRRGGQNPPKEMIVPMLVGLYEGEDIEYGRTVLQDILESRVEVWLSGDTVASLCVAAGRKKKPEAARELINAARAMKLDMRETYFVSLINAYAMLKDTIGAEESLREALDDAGLPPSTALFNCVMKAHAQTGNVDGVQELLEQMRHLGINPNRHSFNNLAFVHAVNRDAEAVEQCFEEMKREGYPMDLLSYNLLLKVYVQQRNISAIRECWQSTRRENISPDTHTYSTIIAGLAYCGYIHEATHILEHMFSEGMRPVAATFDPILRVLVKTGRADEAVRLFDEVRRKGIEPDLRLYRALIAGLVQLGKMSSARTVGDNVAQLFSVETSDLFKNED